MKKEKSEKALNPYELKPPEICIICGASLYDKRQTRIWMGKRCCRNCEKRGDKNASFDNV